MMRNVQFKISNLYINLQIIIWNITFPMINKNQKLYANASMMYQ